MSNLYDKSLDWILQKKYWWVWHLLFWLFIYLDEFLSIFGITDSFDSHLEVLFGLVVDLLTVYVNLYYLFPTFFIKNKIRRYFGLTLLTLVANAWLCVYIYAGFIENAIEFRTMLISSFIGTTTIVAMAFAIKLFKNYITKQQKINELATTGLKTELQFLKNQINPHFLFNSLNNIYVQSRKRPEEVPSSILQLSDLLRYQLYDCSNEKVSLKGEIAYLNNYLQLDALRKSNAQIDLNVIGDPSGHQVAPFIFIPFVENAIKHGMSVEESSNIEIRFTIQQATLQFQVKNSKPKTPIPSKDGGIGLVNVQRRLDLLYPNKHQLQIEETERDYQVNLRLEV